MVFNFGLFLCWFWIIFHYKSRVNGFVMWKVFNWLNWKTVVNTAKISWNLKNCKSKLVNLSFSRKVSLKKNLGVLRNWNSSPRARTPILKARTWGGIAGTSEKYTFKQIFWLLKNYGAATFSARTTSKLDSAGFWKLQFSVQSLYTQLDPKNNTTALSHCNFEPRTGLMNLKRHLLSILFKTFFFPTTHTGTTTPEFYVRKNQASKWIWITNDLLLESSLIDYYRFELEPLCSSGKG